MEPHNTPTPSANNNQPPVPRRSDPQSPGVPAPQQPSWQAAAPQSSFVPGGNGQFFNPGMPASAPVIDGVSSGARNKKKRLVLASAIVGAVLVLGGGTAAAYYGYVVPNKPQNILGRALANEYTPGKVTTEQAHGSFTVKSGDSSMNMSGSFKSKVDKAGAFEVSGDFDAMVTKVTFDFLSPDAKDMYVRVGGLDGLAQLLPANANLDGTPATDVYGPIIKAVNDQWFVINQSLLQQAGGSADLSNGFKMSDSDRQKLAEAYKQHQFVIVQQKLKDEKIGSRNSYHFKVIVDKQQAKEFFKALKAVNLSSIKLSDDQLKSLDSSLDKANFSKYPVDIWVAKSQKLIDQVSFSFTDDGDTASMTYTLDDWNKPVKITKPADAKSLLQLLGQMYGGNGSMDMQSLLDSSTQPGGSGISL